MLYQYKHMLNYNFSVIPLFSLSLYPNPEKIRNLNIMIGKDRPPTFMSSEGIILIKQNTDFVLRCGQHSRPG